MPISFMGQLRPAMAKSRAGEGGVTLIEMLVVLVIIGVAAGIVTFALPSGPAPRAVSQEAELLETRLNLAVEYSLVTAKHMRMQWNNTGYGFEVWNADRWETYTDISQGGLHQLDGAIVLVDENGSRSGTLRINPDALPDGGTTKVLSMGAGTSQRSVRFDGALASVLP